MDNTADIQTVDISSHDEETSQMILFAKLAAQVLTRHYPEHIWIVGFMPGMAIAIKNMAIEDGRYGYTVDAGKAASISEFERAVVIGGGELLERCGVKRGAWNGEFMRLQDISTY